MLLVTLLYFNHILKTFQCSSPVLINFRPPYYPLKPPSTQRPNKAENSRMCKTSRDVRGGEALLVGSGFCWHVRSNWGGITTHLLAFSSKATDSMKCILYSIIQIHQNKSTGNSSTQLKITLKGSSLQGCPPDFCLLSSQLFKKSLPCQPHGRRKSHPSSHREFSQCNSRLHV